MPTNKNIINDNNYKDFNVSIEFVTNFSKMVHKATVTYEVSLLSKIFLTNNQRVTIKEDVEYPYNIKISFVYDNHTHDVIIDDLDYNRLSSQHISYSKNRNKEILNIFRIYNFYNDYVLKKCKDKLKSMDYIKSNYFIEQVMGVLKDFLKKNQKDMDEGVYELKISIKDLINEMKTNKRIGLFPKSLYEYVDVYGVVK